MKVKTPVENDDMRPEYQFDYSSAVRGKYYGRLLKEGANVVVLEPDVARAFRSSAAVSEALRSLLKMSEASRRVSTRSSGRAKDARRLPASPLGGFLSSVPKPSGTAFDGSPEMDTTWRAILWQQFGAAIDMLENALLACPDELWSDRSQRPEFWYVVYHTLFWLDLYQPGSVEGFDPPAPFTLEELDPAGLLPERPYTKDELKTYLEHGRKKCRAAIEALTEEKARQRCGFEWGDVSVAELLLYNMRHVQHHAAQLNLILRQTIDSAPGWVAKTKSHGIV